MKNNTIDKLKTIFSKNNSSYHNFYDFITENQDYDDKEIFSSFEKIIEIIEGYTEKRTENNLNNFINFIDKPILFNFLYFYRYMISTSSLFVNKTKQIQYYESLTKLYGNIDSNWIKEIIPWSISLTCHGNKTLYNTDEYYKRVLDYDFNINNKLCYQYITNKYLSLHLLLIENCGIQYNKIKQSENSNTLEIIKNFRKDLQNYQYDIINNYITFVNRHPSIEQIFGVTIETDMKMAYESLGFKK